MVYLRDNLPKFLKGVSGRTFCELNLISCCLELPLIKGLVMMYGASFMY